jgi:hypothetical protein
MALITAAGIGTGLQLIDTLVRSSKSNKLLKSLEKKGMPQYRTAQDIQREAQATAKGFSPEEMAKARGDIARQAQAGYQRAVQTNPNLANVIQAGINYGTVTQYGDLAARDAMMRRQRASELAQMLTAADVRKTGEERQIQLRAIEAAGLAKQQAAQQRMDALLGFTSVMGSAAMGGYFNKTNPSGVITGAGAGKAYSGPPSLTAANIPLSTQTQYSQLFPSYLRKNQYMYPGENYLPELYQAPFIPQAGD